MSILKSLLIASFKSQTTYLRNFLFENFFTAVSIFSNFLVISFLLMKFKNIDGWTLYEIAVIHGIITFGTAVFRLFGSGVHNFEIYILKGELDILLLKPIPIPIQLLLQRFEFRRLGQLLQALFVGLWGASHIYADNPMIYIEFFVLCIFSAIIVTETSFLIAAIAFWTGKNRDIIALTFFSTSEASLYPTSIYSRPLQGFLTFIVPFACIAYWPLSYIKGHCDSLLALFSPLLTCICFFLINVLVWKKGMHRYSSTGS